MKEISALDLRKKFGQVMDEVRYGKEPCVVKKNGRPVMVLVDIDVFRSSQARIEEEPFIEEYTEERVREFLKEDALGSGVVRRLQKSQG